MRVIFSFLCGILLERPQLWFDKNGDPAVLFCAAREKTNKRETEKPTFNVHIPLKKID